MRSSKFFPMVAIGLAACMLSGCAAIEAQRHEEEAKQAAFVVKVDRAHIWITTGSAPAGRQYTVLGNLKYSEPFSPEALEEDHITNKLKDMALAKWPDSVDAIIKENQTQPADGSSITVTAQAIQYAVSADRSMMHQMNSGIVASPSDNSY
ncbi:MAG: hypothetical protein ACREQI_16085 [Candidatus Binataceae bacterium]